MTIFLLRLAPLACALAACRPAPMPVRESADFPPAPPGMSLIEDRPALKALERLGLRVNGEASDGRQVAVALDGSRPGGALRFLAYDAVLSGAQAVWFVGGSSETVKPRLAELRAMAPVFAGRPIPLPFQPDLDALAGRAWTIQARDYVVLVNRGRRAVIVPEALLDRRWRPLFVPRRDPREALIAHGGYHWLPAYGVLVLESRLRPGRLLGL